MTDMVPVEDVVGAFTRTGVSVDEAAGVETGFPTARVIRPPTPRERFKNRGMAVVVPTRGAIHPKIITSWNRLGWPMNAKRGGPEFATVGECRNVDFAKGYEVGLAYEALVQGILDHPVMGQWPYLVTLEDDNIPPSDAIFRLLETIEEGPWDAVSGIYFTKDALHAPMCYGDVESFRKTGVTDYRPIDLDAVGPCLACDEDRDIAVAAFEAQVDKSRFVAPKKSEKPHTHVVECLGIAMGCAIWKMDLFRQVPGPWFQTMEEHMLVDGTIVKRRDAELASKAGLLTVEKECRQLATQDFSFCEKAVVAGKRFACDLRITVGHFDINTEVTY